MKLSVIVCTYNRSHAIIPCLDSIAASFAQAAPIDAEIVVVDNASTDNSFALIREWAKTCAFPVNLQLETKKGTSAARNCGIRASHGALIAFTDDDCQMSQTYVEEFLRYDAGDKEPVLRSGSVVLGDPTDLPMTIKSVAATQRWKRPMDVNGEGMLMGGSLIGCNMATRRTVLDRIGPFDEKLGPGTDCLAAEDTDYFYRAYLADIALEMVPDLIISHHHGRKEIRDWVNLSRNYMIGNGAVSIKYLFRHPNFSRHFYWQMKSCLYDFFSYGKKGKPDASLTPFERMKYMMLGALLYVRSCLKLQRSTEEEIAL